MNILSVTKLQRDKKKTKLNGHQQKHKTERIKKTKYMKKSNGIDHG